MPRHSLTALSSVSILASWLAASPASALGYIDQQALNHADHAMGTEYLQMHFDAAEKELKQALMLCGPGACAPEVVGRVHRDLGVIYLVGMRRTAAGKAELTAALKADPGVTLDPDLTTPELDAAFKAAAAALGITPGEAKKNAAPEPPPEAPAEAAAAPAEDATAEAPAASSGAMVHVSPTEQTMNTPLPLYVEGSPAFKAVDVHYKPFGETEWKKIGLRPMKGGWGIQLPCLDLGTTGKLSYYIDAYDASGAVVSSSGSREQPHEVAIVTDLAAEPPHLPGRAPPSQCSDASDCPPDFPGCESKDSLSKDDKKSSGPERRNWIGLGVQQDFLVLGGTKGVCDGAAGYTCFRSNATYYDVTPLSTANGEVAGGVSVATTRLLLAYDRVIADNWTIGARAGYAFGGGPTAPGGSAFLPAHAELRGAYFFGKAPFERHGLRPFVQVSGGLAQIDTEISVKTYDDQQSFNSSKTTELNAWRKSGTEFASLGGGVAYALASQHAIIAEVRFMQMFGLSVQRVHLESLNHHTRTLSGSLAEKQVSIIGKAPSMVKLYRVIAKAALSGGNVLITGESGTGKELVAHAIHDNGPWSEKAVHHGQLRRLDLKRYFESELFGARSRERSRAPSLNKKRPI